MSLLGALLLLSAVLVYRELALRSAKAPTVAQGPPLEKIPVEQWTPRIRALLEEPAWDALDEELGHLQRSEPELYRRFRLDYLKARVEMELGEWGQAEARLTQFLHPRDPFRPLALYHAARCAEQQGKLEDARLLRQRLIFDGPDSLYRERAIEQQVAELRKNAPEILLSFVDRATMVSEGVVQRDLLATQVETLLVLKREDEASALGFRLLESESGDDPAERVFSLFWDELDMEHLSAEQLFLLGSAAHAHRHFERAIALLERSRAGMADRRETIDFLVGRAYFWNEQYEEAQRAYLEAASKAGSREQEASLLFHAARAAQLRDDDATAEQLMTRCIGVKGNFSSTAAALTQRMRTRLRQGRHADALGDLRLLFRLFPRSSSVVEGAIAYVASMVAAGRNDEALRILQQIPDSETDAFHQAEMAYWRGRALEASDPLSALDAYLDVLNATAPSRYKAFVRERLTQPEVARQVNAAIARRRTRIRSAADREMWDLARALQTEIVRMTAGRDEEEVARLREVYLEIPSFRAFAELEPLPLPAFPIDPDLVDSPAGRGGPSDESEPEGPSRTELLMAMGLYDEAASTLEDLYPSSAPSALLTRALVLREADALRQSIRTIETLERSLPDHFVHSLLPRQMRELLHPRYFYDTILEQAQEIDADPRLLLAIMREESRFDPRAKSPAAARGLLQFVITTAREIALELGLESLVSQELYEPDVVIRLGARYVGRLMAQFDGDRPRTTAAYNAGPNQARLWGRLAPAEGDDYFFVSINFNETRDYVRKVMNSYEAYGELYETPSRP